jgi:hypothetical protein
LLLAACISSDSSTHLKASGFAPFTFLSFAVLASIEFTQTPAPVHTLASIFLFVAFMLLFKFKFEFYIHVSHGSHLGSQLKKAQLLHTPDLA